MSTSFLSRQNRSIARYTVLTLLAVLPLAAPMYGRTPSGRNSDTNHNSVQKPPKTKQGKVPDATLRIQEHANGRARVLINAQGVDPKRVYRVFNINSDPTDFRPISDRAPNWRTERSGELACTFENDRTLLKPATPIALTVRAEEAPEDKGSYRAVLFGLLKQGAATTWMAPSPNALLSEPQARKHVSGALIAEDFDGPALDMDLWRIWQEDVGLAVEQKQGNLVISGRTGKVREISKFPPKRFTGLVSKARFFPPDAVLVAKMKVPGGIKSSSGLERYMVHYCGATPDYFTEVIFGRDLHGWSGWSFIARSLYAYYEFGDVTQAPEDYLPELVGERNPDDWQLVKIDYDSSTQTSRGYLWAPSAVAWHRIGKPQHLFLSSVQVELKVNIPQDDLNVEVRFDDCRLYRKPETTPVRILVYKQPQPPGFVFPGVSVRLYEANGRTLIGKGVTNHNGVCSISLSSRLTYPIAAVIKIDRGEESLGSAEIRSSGVQGLYPGDLWVVNAPGRIRGFSTPKR